MRSNSQLVSAFLAATRSGDLNALMQLLANDVRVITDGGGKVAAALNVLKGADRAARFLVGAAPKGWRADFTQHVVTINGLPGVIVAAPEGPVQTVAFEIEGDVIRALYVVRNPEKLRHLSARSTPQARAANSVPVQVAAIGRSRSRSQGVAPDGYRVLRCRLASSFLSARLRFFGRGDDPGRTQFCDSTDELHRNWFGE